LGAALPRFIVARCTTMAEVVAEGMECKKQHKTEGIGRRERRFRDTGQMNLVSLLCSTVVTHRCRALCSSQSRYRVSYLTASLRPLLLLLFVPSSSSSHNPHSLCACPLLHHDFLPCRWYLVRALCQHCRCCIASISQGALQVEPCDPQQAASTAQHVEWW
jgi:hypothetical protein